MKKITRYLLTIIVVFLAITIAISFFYLRSAYRSMKQSELKVVPKQENTIQILEGWTTSDIGAYLEKEDFYKDDQFLAVAGYPRVDYRKNISRPALPDFSAEFSFLADKPEYYGLEGYLFPDTYRVYASSTVSEMIEKVLGNFDKKLTAQMRSDIKAQGRTIYEVITLASIVEKEAPLNYQTNDNRDAKIIAGIFLNRLKIGQALQSDATLSYIYGDNKAAHSWAELENNSLYNTYKYRGLPPGPICNPGILAIEAAIYPIKTDYNYFLTPKGKNEVIYARTYAEHLKNKYQYLK